MGIETFPSWLLQKFPCRHLSRRGVNGNYYIFCSSIQFLVTSHSEVGIETSSLNNRSKHFSHLSRRGVNRNCISSLLISRAISVTSHAEVGIETRQAASEPVVARHLSRRGVNGNPMSSGFRGIKQCHLSCRGVNRNKPVLVSNIVTYVTSRAEV